MKHVMVDIETLGTSPGSVILSIGACRFDETGVGERFYRPIDVFDSMMNGLVVDQATIGWWRMQPAESRGALQAGAVPLARALNDFRVYLAAIPSQGQPSADFLWAKGPDFDLVMLEAAYGLLGDKKPWRYNTARDVRTILALGKHPTVPVAPFTIAHHALDDAVYQARQVIAAAASLGVVLSEMA